MFFYIFILSDIKHVLVFNADIDVFCNIDVEYRVISAFWLWAAYLSVRLSVTNRYRAETMNTRFLPRDADPNEHRIMRFSPSLVQRF